MASNCYCSSGKKFQNCCQPILNGEQSANSAEALMRSRYTAYCTHNYFYILNTYASVKRQQLSQKELEDAAQDTIWLHLEIVSPAIGQDDQVEFKAWSKERNTVFLLHETSRFIKEQEQWRYLDGQLHQDCGKVTIGRNEPCFCSSGKKYKQCCLRR
ncbi:YchJ family metal-binding protein [Alteromonas ponticola]|uniref:YchJ family metal-binding protein n=1 Tax=Alteromonas aquimaris TaxID=2998417 RepID=A0ABT3P7F1_9ALTE|nr:YchJ family metal-binding protein [Alteromonas aquimaris]MCW8108692.1 YchJ family metal-binding protein [Alteromonas aquimaris]